MAAVLSDTTEDFQLDDSLRQYVSKFVWETASDPTKRNLVVDTLTKGNPYIETEFMVVAMVDISGYSQIMADLVSFLRNFTVG
jgi:hypothetical protein